MWSGTREEATTIVDVTSPFHQQLPTGLLNTNLASMHRRVTRAGEKSPFHSLTRILANKRRKLVRTPVYVNRPRVARCQRNLVCRTPRALVLKHMSSARLAGLRSGRPGEKNIALSGVMSVVSIKKNKHPTNPHLKTIGDRTQQESSSFSIRKCAILNRFEFWFWL